MREQNRRERGFTLLLTVLTLLLLTSLGFAALNVVQTDQQVAGYLNRKRVALNAADAAVSRALETLQSNGTPTIPTTTLGDGGAFPYGQPTYGVDTTAATPVESLGVGGISGMNIRVGQNGAVQFQMQYWRVRVQGEAPGGTVSRLEFVAGNLVAN
jgi:type II secretory pathway pseudopilin PulG